MEPASDVDAEMSRQNAPNQVIRARPNQGQVTTPPQNKLQILQSTPLRATRGVAATPFGKEKEIYPYYCPICMWYYRTILKTTCCGGQYLCEFCIHSLVCSLPWWAKGKRHTRRFFGPFFLGGVGRGVQGGGSGDGQQGCEGQPHTPYITSPYSAAHEPKPQRFAQEERRTCKR